QNELRRARNRAVKSSLRTQLKKVRQAITAGDIAAAETEFKVAAKRLDQAGAHRVIHPNVAGRTKSRLQHLIVKAKQGTAQSA
ncbi:MAG: 30S ribosomal protein S20, partial [Planctomycetales bacterium]|nr:30S ribosomal protein S20 [Planctomycetales bacterium]